MATLRRRLRRTWRSSRRKGRQEGPRCGFGDTCRLWRREGESRAHATAYSTGAPDADALAGAHTADFLCNPAFRMCFRDPQVRFGWEMPTSDRNLEEETSTEGGGTEDDPSPPPVKGPGAPVVTYSFSLGSYRREHSGREASSSSVSRAPPRSISMPAGRAAEGKRIDSVGNGPDRELEAVLELMGEWMERPESGEKGEEEERRPVCVGYDGGVLSRTS